MAAQHQAMIEDAIDALTCMRCGGPMPEPNDWAALETGLAVCDDCAPIVVETAAQANGVE